VLESGQVDRSTRADCSVGEALRLSIQGHENDTAVGCEGTVITNQGKRCNLQLTGVAIGSGLWETVGHGKTALHPENERYRDS
jgi:hypothetical protein